ncbi:MAG: FAD-dependent oxidoreductase [Elainellaceae cyanobacterium]
MTVDYNLVILGGSVTARYAAELARRLKARVALVEPHESARTLLDTALLSSETEALALQAAQQVSSGDWQECSHWGHRVSRHQMQQRSLDSLAMLGIDVVMGGAEFCRRDGDVGVWVKGNKGKGDRWLIAHSYLLCPGSVPTLPPITGLIDVPFLTLDDVLALKPSQPALPLDGHSLIVGPSPRAVELAQTLARQGKTVTLLVESKRFGDGWDADVARLLLAHLEADGVAVQTGTQALQAKSIDGQVWVQTTQRAIAVDHLIFATQRQPLLGHLHLGAANIDLNDGFAGVNQKLQTSHKRIYACGDAIAPDLTPNQIRSQADVAVRNSLFLPTRIYNSQSTLTQINTVPAVVHIGATEIAARQQWGDRLGVVQAQLLITNRAALEHKTSGFCKLLLRPNGTILGGHAVGGEAGEWIGAIALAMQHNIPFQKLATIHAPSATFAEVLNQMALDWQTQKLEGDRLRFNLLELAMNWRRDWSNSR